MTDIHDVLSQEECNRIAAAIIDNPMSPANVISIIELSAGMMRKGYTVDKALAVIFNYD